MNLLHCIFEFEADLYSTTQFISIFNTHTKQSLHGFELGYIFFINSINLCLVIGVKLVDELDNSARDMRIHWSRWLFGCEDWSNHEVLHVGTRALVVNFLLELGFLRSIVGEVKFFSFKHNAWNSRACREKHEILIMDLSYLFILLLFCQWFLFFMVIHLGLLRLLFLGPIQISWSFFSTWAHWKVIITMNIIFVIRILSLVVVTVSSFILWSVWISNKLPLFEAVQQDTNGLKTKECW